MMDKDNLHGRVVAERVYRGRRLQEPHVLTAVAHKPDFRLVPKDEEEQFCKWNEVCILIPNSNTFPDLLPSILYYPTNVASVNLVMSCNKVFFPPLF